MNEIFVLGTRVRAVQADITALKVDAIVNAANNLLAMGGGLAAAIKSKGGGRVEKEAMALGPVGVGEAVVTGAGTMPSKHIIHAVTMAMDLKTDESKIRLSARNALAAAHGLRVSSLAIPALGCGVGRFPVSASAKIIAQEVYRHLRETEKSSLKEIIFCLYDVSALAAFERDALSYLDYICNRLKSPFLTVDAIIEIGKEIVVIKRTNPPFGWALPGGFVDYGESLEEAVCREAREETGLVLSDVKQFHTFSAPERDPRFHTVSTVFSAKATGQPTAGDDAAEVKVGSFEILSQLPFAFDHKQIIQEYLQYGK